MCRKIDLFEHEFEQPLALFDGKENAYAYVTELMNSMNYSLQYKQLNRQRRCGS